MRAPTSAITTRCNCWRTGAAERLPLQAWALGFEVTESPCKFHYSEPPKASATDANSMRTVEHDFAEHLALSSRYSCAARRISCRGNTRSTTDFSTSGENMAQHLAQFAASCPCRNPEARAGAKTETQIDAWHADPSGGATGDQRAGGLQGLHALVPGGGAHVLE